MSSRSTLSKSQKSLLRIVMTNDKSQVEELLKQPLELSPEELGVILWHAVRLGTLEIAAVLVLAGADINLTNPFDDSGSSLLHYLMANIDPRYYEHFAGFLIEHGANINACNNKNETVLHWAIMKSKPVEVIDNLFELGACVKNSSDNNFYELNANFSTPRLIDTDSDSKTRSKRAGEALTCCILNVQSDKKLLLYTEMFLSKRFSVKDLENDGRTLYWAIENGPFDLVRLLVNYGFDVNRPAKNIAESEFDTNSPKYDILPVYSASSLQTSDELELLIRAGAKIKFEVEDPEKHKGYAIHAACENESEDNIEILLRHGADITVTDHKDRTPLTLIDDIGNFGEVRQKIIRHLALLASKGKSIKHRDMDTIQKSHVTHKYYTHCTKELEVIKSLKMISDIPLSSIFYEDLTELLYVNRNHDFVENLQQKDKFPIFYKKIDSALQSAKRLKKWLNDVEESLQDALGNTLPYIPIEKIVYYSYLNIIK